MSSAGTAATVSVGRTGGGGRTDGDAWVDRRVLVLGQKLLAARAVADVPFAFALVALGF
jgi:hypothetical protein